MIKLLNRIFIFLLLFIVGCGFSVPDFETVYDAELPGNKYIARNFTIMPTEAKIFPFSFSVEKRVVLNSTPEYYLVLLGSSKTESEIELPNPDKSLIISIDGNPIILSQNDTYQKSTYEMPLEDGVYRFFFNTFLYKIEMEQIKKLSLANKIVIELFTDRDYYNGQLLQEDINKFKIFLDKYGDK